MNPDLLPIRLICATKLPKDQFLSHSATAKSTFALKKACDAEVSFFPSNTLGLSQVYNKAIKEAAKKPAILVFIHDDVFIADLFWTHRIRNGLKQFDIVGLAGNTTRIAKQASWIYLDAGKKMANSKHFSGCVGHGNQFPPKVVSNYGPVGLECKLLDGLLLAVNSETLQRTGLRFDERFKFHLYDTDFCRSAEALKLKMGTISLSAVHQSGGNFSSDEFKRQYKDYLLKWVD